MRAVVVLVLAGVAAASSPTLTQELNYGKIPSDVSLIGKSAASGCNTQHEYNGVQRGPYNAGVLCSWPSKHGVDQRPTPCLRIGAYPKCRAPGPPTSHLLDDKIAQGHQPCQHVVCQHLERHGTSSIVVRHPCVSGEVVKKARASQSSSDWLTGLQSAKTDDQMKTRSCIETVCKNSHYCGMNSNGDCQCVQGDY